MGFLRSDVDAEDCEGDHMPVILEVMKASTTETLSSVQRLKTQTENVELQI